MKSKMKHFSKSSLSILLTLIMLVSTIAVGMISANAWTDVKVKGTWDSWTEHGSEGSGYTVYLNPGTSYTFGYTANGSYFGSGVEVYAGYDMYFTSGGSDMTFIPSKGKGAVTFYGYQNPDNSSEIKAYIADNNANFYLYGDSSFATGWNTSTSKVQMTYESSSGYYYYDFTPSSNKTEWFRIYEGTTGTYFCPDSGSNTVVTTSSSNASFKKGDSGAFNFNSTASNSYRIWINPSNSKVWYESRTPHTVTLSDGSSGKTQSATLSYNGTTSSSVSAPSGATVTVTAYPAEGYIANVTTTAGSLSESAITTSGGTVTLTMPDANCTVSITYTVKPAGPDDSELSDTVGAYFHYLKNGDNRANVTDHLPLYITKANSNIYRSKSTAYITGVSNYFAGWLSGDSTSTDSAYSLSGYTVEGTGLTGITYSTNYYNKPGVHVSVSGTSVKCYVEYNASNQSIKFVAVASYDPFYIGGRFVTDSAYTGDYAGDWKTFDNNIKLTQGSNNIWSINTGKTIAELSAELLAQSSSSTNPQYFIIHDSVTTYASSIKDDGLYFQNFKGSANALTLNPAATLNIDYELRFNDEEATSDGDVVIYVDASNYSQGSGSLSIWYDIENETDAVANHMTFTVSPAATTVNKYATLTATIADIHTGVDSTDKVQVIFEKYNGSTWDTVATVTNITEPETGKMRAQTTVTNATAGTYTYRARVATTGSYSGTSLREISKSASGKWNEQTVYYTDDITSSVASPTWSAVPTTGDKTATISPTLSEGESYTIALSDEAAYNPNFEDFTIDTELTKYCDIKIASKTVTIDNEDRVVRTYVITPRTNCSNPVITIDAANEKIYAVATFDKYSDSGKTLSNTTETVKYYFAKPADKDFTGSNNLDGTKGMYIKYYNNSVTSKTATKWAVPVKVDGTTSSGEYSATSVQYTGSNSDYTNYQIRVDKSQLFRNTTENSAYSSTTNDWIDCNVYVLEMPIWATSANFCNSSGTTQLGSPILALNPNRIYVFWSTGDNDKQWSGVPLDTSFWVSEQSGGAHKRGDLGYAQNQVPTKNFKTNLINYETGADYGGTINNTLSSEYSSRSIDRTLYWGMFANDHPSSLYNWDIALNLAQRKNDQSYYASVWESVNPELSKNTSNNPLGGGMLRAYGSDALMPFFDYEYLDTTDGKKVGTAYTDKDFPFYASQFDGVTTYSYDSMVDLNRRYKVADGNYVVEDQTVKLGSNLGYAPFHGESVTDTIAGFANEYDINFYMTTTGKLQGTKENHDISFNFSGDDDVWVFVDGVLVLDLGGAHKISAGSINFSDMKVYYKTAANDFTSDMGTSNDWATSSNNVYTMDLKALFEAHGVNFKNTDATTKHTLQMFYTERGRLESNMSLSFNLPQASGLNIRNTVRANSVNAGLKDVALQASDPDYFTYRVGNMAADDSAITTLKTNKAGTIYANALLPSSTTGWSASNVTPVFPYKFNVSRFFEGDTMILGSTADNRTVTNGSTLGDLTSSWQYLRNTVYGLSDYYTPDDIADDAKLSGITNNDTDGYFHLLGGQMANFTDKIRPNSYVQVVQTQELGEAVPDTDNNDIIKYNTVSDNNTGNYFITSYDIYDEAAAKNVVDETMYTVRYGDNDADNYYANDESAVTNGFYFTNYAADSSNPNPAMTVNFYNDIAVGDLTIEKKLTKTSTVSDNFYFKVEFENIFGDDSYNWDEYDVEYTVHNVSDGTQVGTKQSYGTVGIVIKPGQYAKISGIPVETRYRVTEVSRAGYTLSDIDKTAKKSNGTAINTTYVPSGFYEFADQSDATAGTSGGVTQEGWSDGNMTALDKTYVNTNIDPDYTYYCNMIPVVPETLVSGDDYVSTSAFVFTNKKESYTIQFKYYDRYRINGTTAGINSTPTVYSVSLDSLPANRTGTLGDYITYVNDNEANGVQSIDFSELIGYYAKEFAQTTLNINNVMCEYEMWTSQEAAVAAMTGEDYFNGDGTTGQFTAEEAQYQATYLGKPNSSGEKWVTFTDTNRKEVAQLTTPSDYLSVRNIVVWCYNTPKQYKVNVYGADDYSDLTAKTVGSNTVYVADANETDKSALNNKFYYNQRFGDNTAGADELNAAGFISNYGIPGVYSGDNGNLCPEDYASATISNGGKTYNFAYWAYDQAGTQLASTDIKYKYRVTTATDLYAVYVEGDADDDVGISVSANDNDTYLDSNGTSYTRLNVMANVYNAADYDPLVQKISFVNITLSTQIRTDPTTYTPAKINELFNEYKDQLLAIIRLNDTSSNFSFSGSNTYNGTIDLTLTTRGFIYTVVSNGNTPADGEPEIRLTNKNRGQLTVSYKTSTLVKGNNNPTCLVYCGAVKYNGQWKISDNCLIYRNGDVTDNTQTSWN